MSRAIVGKPGEPIIWLDQHGQALPENNPCPHPSPVVVRDKNTGVGYVRCPACGWTNEPRKEAP